MKIRDWLVVGILMISLFVSVVPSSYVSATTITDSSAILENSQVKWVHIWPEIPLPNATVLIHAYAPNVSDMRIQMCFNTMCFIPQQMKSLGNGLFEYIFVPGQGHYPPTKNGDEVDYHLLINGTAVFNGTFYVRNNAPPVLGNITLNRTKIHLGDILKISVNATDDYAIHNVTCYVTSSEGTKKLEMKNEENGSTNGTYYTSLKITSQGNYFVKIVAFDNSNQSSFVTTNFFVYPPEHKDKTPPRLLDAYGLLNGTRLIIKVYLEDESGVSSARIELNSTWYNLIQIEPGIFQVVLQNVSKGDIKNVRIFAEDPYNNTLNESISMKIYNITPPIKNTNSSSSQKGSGGIGLALALLAMGLLFGVIFTLFFKNRRWLFILIVVIFSLGVSIANSYPAISRDAGGNIFNGNTCWSCLGLQPHNAPKGWLVDYPNGTPVHHPKWILEMLKSKPILIYIHQVPCTGCEIQWKDMISSGIITPEGKLTSKYAGKIDFVVLDITYNSPTREKGMEAMHIYSLGQIGTPTTILLTKKGNTVYWYSKTGIVHHQELEKLINEAISMYGG